MARSPADRSSRIRYPACGAGVEGKRMQFDRMKRRVLITLLGGAAVWPLAARAQQLAKIRRIGWLVFGSAELGPVDKTLWDALAQRGFVHGRNIDVTFRYA